MIGALIGAGAGAVLGLVLGLEPPALEVDETRRSAVVSVALAMLVCAGAGAAAGAGAELVAGLAHWPRLRNP